MSDGTRQKRSCGERRERETSVSAECKRAQWSHGNGYKVTQSVTSAGDSWGPEFMYHIGFLFLFVCLFEPTAYNKQHFIHNEREIWKTWSRSVQKRVPGGFPIQTLKRSYLHPLTRHLLFTFSLMSAAFGVSDLYKLVLYILNQGPLYFRAKLHHCFAVKLTFFAVEGIALCLSPHQHQDEFPVWAELVCFWLPGIKTELNPSLWCEMAT